MLYPISYVAFGIKGIGFSNIIIQLLILLDIFDLVIHSILIIHFVTLLIHLVILLNMASVQRCRVVRTRHRDTATSRHYDG